jgi:ribonuclease-3
MVRVTMASLRQQEAPPSQDENMEVKDKTSPSMEKGGAVPGEADLARVLGVRFRDPARLTEALTHRSYLHDHPGIAGHANERLEFLGDAVVNFVVAKLLFDHHPNASEGELTALRALLVSTAALADVAERIGLDRFVRASGGEGSLAGRGRARILAGTVEAIIGAALEDTGIRTARALALRLLRPRLKAAVIDLQTANVKGRLQEHVQAGSGETPRYVTVGRDGPVHAERFRVEVRVDDRVLGAGEGTGKRAAEHAAARDALTRLLPTASRSHTDRIAVRSRDGGS